MSDIKNRVKEEMREILKSTPKFLDPELAIRRILDVPGIAIREGEMTDEDFRLEFAAFQMWCLEKKERYISDESVIRLWLEYEEEKAKEFPYK